MARTKEQPTLSKEFEDLWPAFEGEKVAKVVMNFAGEVDLSANAELCQSLDYLGEIEFTIRGTVTGKKFSHKGGDTVGSAILTIDRVQLAGSELLTRAGTRAAARAAKVEQDDAIFDPDFTPDGIEAPEGSALRIRGAANEYADQVINGDDIDDEDDDS